MRAAPCAGWGIAASWRSATSRSTSTRRTDTRTMSSASCHSARSRSWSATRSVPTTSDSRSCREEGGCEVARLGSEKHPAVVRVRSFERAEQILALCNRHGWQVIVGVEEDKPEDVTDFEKLLRGNAMGSATRTTAQPK